MPPRRSALLLLAILPALAASALADAGKPVPRTAPAPPAPSVEEDGSLGAELEGYLEALPTGEISIPLRNLVLPSGRRVMWNDWAFSFFATELLLYESNIFLSERNEEDAFISATSLGAQAERQGTNIGAEVIGVISQEIFLDEPDENSLEGHLRGGLVMSLGQSRMQLSAAFTQRKQATQVVADGDRPGVEIASGSRVAQATGSGTLAVGHEWPGFSLSLQYPFRLLEFGNALDQGDSVQHQLTLVARYKASPKLGYSAQLEHREVRFRRDQNNDYRTEGGFGGLDWAASEKTSLAFRAGFVAQVVDQTGAVPDDSEFRGLSASLSGGWELSEKTSLSLRYSRDLSLSIGENYQAIDLLGLGVRWELAPGWDLSARTGLQMTRPSTRPDATIYSAGASISRRLESWLSMSLRYDFRLRNAARGGTDYTNHVGGIQLSFLF